MRISDWSSDVCSSDLAIGRQPRHIPPSAPELRTQERKIEPGVVRGDRKAGDVWCDVAGNVAEQRRSGDVRICDAVDVEIGSAACRGRVCQYGLISVVAVSLKQKE